MTLLAAADLAQGVSTSTLLDVERLSVTFRREGRDIEAVRDVSFQLAPGKVLCIIGESGSGKSVTLRAIMRLLSPATRLEGHIRLDGHDMLALSERRLGKLRGPLVSMVFQEPMNAFDPVYTVGQQIGETLRRHEGIDHKTAAARSRDLLELVQVPRAAERLNSYPHELSGGLRQRAMIALALACRPRLLLADEPTTALDATVQIQVLLLLRRLQLELDMAMIFVTHDLSVGAQIADDVAVMYAGRFVESGRAASVLSKPSHPYTVGLMASSVGDKPPGAHLDAIPGQPPDPSLTVKGCAFVPRCSRRIDLCYEKIPASIEVAPGHVAACTRLGIQAP